MNREEEMAANIETGERQSADGAAGSDEKSDHQLHTILENIGRVAHQDDPRSEFTRPLDLEAFERKSIYDRKKRSSRGFTRYLFAYPSDGLRITGMLNRPKGKGPFPVVILNHGYYPLDVYQTGNGSKVAADYLANQFASVTPWFETRPVSHTSPNERLWTSWYQSISRTLKRATSCIAFSAQILRLDSGIR